MLWHFWKIRRYDRTPSLVSRKFEITKKSSSSVSVERSSLSLVELFEVVEAVEAIPATEGFLPPGVENPPPIDDPQLRKAMKEFLTRMLLSSRRLPSRWRTTKGLQTKMRGGNLISKIIDRIFFLGRFSSRCLVINVTERSGGWD